MQKTLIGKKVFLTGHTGFKGSWLALWLQTLGATVTGYSLAATSRPSHFELLREQGLLKIESVIGNICDLESLKRAMLVCDPDLIIHMAAQPIVLQSYRDPIETYETNVMGTLKVFEAARALNSGNLRGIVNVTSDKCYENRETLIGYKETDPMGGYDPYSSSKGCAEILFSSYQRSFFPIEKYKTQHQVLMASVRAGNVIGGGDWAPDRLIPDLIRAAKEKRVAEIRNPSAIRPWQHVLEPLAGYLQVAAQLLAGNTSVATGFNFGPDEASCVTVGELLASLQEKWDGISYILGEAPKVHEAHFLKLDSTKARTELAWMPRLNFEETIEWTANWYRSQQESNRLLTEEQLTVYVRKLVPNAGTRA
ncbi:CDP-glucose 4,6-dehydratase [soil metagenome]